MTIHTKFSRCMVSGAVPSFSFLMPAMQGILRPSLHLTKAPAPVFSPGENMLIFIR